MSDLTYTIAFASTLPTFFFFFLTINPRLRPSHRPAHRPNRPDIITLAKPLAGGLPVGAVLCSDEVNDSVDPGDHGSTFGGGPLVAAAAEVVLDRLQEPGFLQSVREKGEALYDRAVAAMQRHPELVTAVRRAPRPYGGMYVGVELSEAPTVSVLQWGQTE